LRRSEEKIIQDGGRKRGFRYVRQGKDWYKQEWDGLKVQGLDEEAKRQLSPASVGQPTKSASWSTTSV